jgi:hypothetical protein
VKLGKNASDTCAVLSKAMGGEAMKSQVFLNGINDSKRGRMLKPQMKMMLITLL